MAGYQIIQLVNSSGLVPVLSLLAKLGRGAISFVIYICPSVRMEQLGSHWIFRRSGIQFFKTRQKIFRLIKI
jgi:hypothetical protein